MIDILLATCNSEKYLREQIDSIFAQDFSDWRLIVRDGGSSDSTCEIIEEYRLRYPERILYLGSVPSGAMENFSALLDNSEAELIMFADHDDVWFTDKISRTLQLYREIEEKYGAEYPAAVFTDAVVTDENLVEISKSNIRNQHLDPFSGLTLARLLIQNVPSGNTMLFNAALRQRVVPLPRECVMHDQYITLAACVCGRIGYLDAPTLFYRQHGKNVLGSSQYSLPGLFARYGKNLSRARRKIFAYAAQAGALLEKFEECLSTEDSSMLREFSNLKQLGWFARRRVLLKYGILKNGFWRNAGIFLFL